MRPPLADYGGGSDAALCTSMNLALVLGIALPLQRIGELVPYIVIPFLPTERPIKRPKLPNQSSK